MNLPIEDRAARERAADPRYNVALEASAGTGKTRVLVDRYLRLVELGADPRHILAITFTRKAAGEMKSRIIEELRRSAEVWEDVRERLFDIHIATIDAFCLGLLKEFPLEAGLDPDVDLLDEVELHTLSGEAIDEVLAGAAGGPGEIDFPFLLARFGELALERGARDFLRSRLVKNQILSAYVATRIPRDLDLGSALRAAASGLRDALGGDRGIERLLEAGPAPPHRLWSSFAFALRRAVSSDLATALDLEEASPYFLTQEGEPRKRPPAELKREDFAQVGDYQRCVELLLAAAPEVAEVFRRWSRDRDLYAVRELWKLYRRASRRFAELKEVRGGLDFPDVLLRAVKLLENRGEFSQSRFRLESRYHHLLIDEFQDTNEVQWRLVVALIESWGEGAGLVQEAILAEQARRGGKGSLREPSIFLVGDRKQSIYGWRDARVEVMEKAARHILGLRPGGAHRLTIRRSFRAEGRLLDFLNDVFSELPKAAEELDWAFRYREADHFPVSARTEEGGAVALAASPDLPAAAAAVADEIVRLVEEEELKPKDIAILFRSRSRYRIYEEALVERGVPAYVYRGLGFFDSPEVRDTQALVRYLAEPGSELRAAELCRSRLLGLSDTALAVLASSRRSSDPASSEGPVASWLGGSPPDRDVLERLSPDDARAAERAARIVPAWLRRVDRTPPSDLLQEILEETDYAACFSGRNGPQGWENLKKIQEIVRRAQNRGYLTLSRLAEYLESASTGEESLAVLEAVDAVNLTTIHAAKGLEFEAVFVVNLHQKTRSDVSLPRIKELPDGRVEVRALTRPESEGPDRISEEEKRLLYVALTRARRKLVLSACTGESESSASLLRLLPDGLRALFQEALTADAPELVWQTKGFDHRIRLLRPAAEPRRYRGSIETPSYHLALSPLSAGEPAHVATADLARPPEDAAVPEPDPVDAAVGRVVHRLLQYSIPEDDGLLAAARALVPEIASRSDGEAAEIARRAAVFYRELGARHELRALLESGEVRAEVPFVLARPGQIVHGVIDSIVRLPDRVAVVDYKTGRARLEHEEQMKIYLEAARELFPGVLVEGWIFYARGEPKHLVPEGAGPGTPAQLSLF